ncbi:hypothetical protein EB796_006143 [Bugula neritina]|uniref:Uncharacterized protein n=1 Tax=Bugula neritina TaxID=10212 RepID=A0A7J7KBE4_BUGNE|nr:hypothetical protein EB796_006143 [Bugula neritina]
MVFVKVIISLCAVALFTGTVEVESKSSKNVCEKSLDNIYCRFEKLVKTKKRANCLSARSLVTKSLAGCVSDDTIKLAFIGVKYIKVFEANCKGIDYPSYDCRELADCLSIAFDKGGKKLLCDKKKVADKCYSKAEGECSVAAKYRKMLITRAYPIACKSNHKYFTMKKPVAPKCYKN